MPHSLQLAATWPQVFGVLTFVANLAVAFCIKRDRKAELPLTLTAVALTLVASSIMWHSLQPTRFAAHPVPNAVFYPAPKGQLQVLPAPFQLRQL